jgi:hypothetical protein
MAHTKFKNHGVLALFSATLFISAALMFSFQLMIGKMLLPIVGGASSAWMVALTFFQVMLLVGYYVSHLLSRFTPLRQAVIYVGMICAGSLFLPVTLNNSAAFIGDVPGPLGVLALLTAAVAVPFIAISATSSTLQRLFTVTDHPASDNPYFLYVASNFGSFAGLLLYPLVIERQLGLKLQSVYWLFGYLLLLAAAGLCLLASRSQQKTEEKKAPAEDAPVAWRQRIKWITLAFVPSCLMMGLTSYVSTEIFSMPLLWVIPLGLYLLTFIVAFSDRKLVSMGWLAKAQPAAVVLSVSPALLYTPNSPYGIVQVIGNQALVFVFVSLMCHTSLAKARPANNQRDLTLFYLLLAVGGALGGIVSVFIIPLVLKIAVEYPVILVASCLLNPDYRFRRWDLLIAAFAGAVLTVKLVSQEHFVDLVKLIATLGPLIIVVSLLALHPRAAFVGCGLLTMVMIHNNMAGAVYEGRNFYGVLKIYDREMTIGNKKEKIRFMMNGTTTHGKQSLEPGMEQEATAYYTKDGPLGEVFSVFKPKTVAAVGLGAGTVACYGTPETNITFFEINPLVQMAAEKYFTFLSKCGTGKKPEVILGDGRLVMARMKQKYDLVILDAFSSDAVPTHLMTKEAVAMYVEHLADNGVLLFHVSNQHFFLGFPIVAEADRLGLASRLVAYAPAENPYADKSLWVAVARDDAVLGQLGKLAWSRLSASANVKPWTDDHTDLLSVLYR